MRCGFWKGQAEGLGVRCGIAPSGLGMPHASERDTAPPFAPLSPSATPREKAALRAALIVGLRLQSRRLFLSIKLSSLLLERVLWIEGCRKVRFMNTHRPATNSRRKSLDDFLETFERDDALWSNNESSVVVRSQDLTPRALRAAGFGVR